MIIEYNENISIETINVRKLKEKTKNCAFFICFLEFLFLPNRL